MGFGSFYKRYGIDKKKQEGEAETVDLEKCKARVKELAGVIQEYDPVDVYNLDETSLFYDGWNANYYTINDTTIVEKSVCRKLHLSCAQVALAT